MQIIAPDKFQMAVIMEWLASPQGEIFGPPILGFAGALIGAFASATFQRRNTSRIIASEYRKIALSFDRQSLARLTSRKEDIIADKVVKLLTHSDPEMQAYLNYSEIVSAVHSIQLFLDYALEPDRRLNHAIQGLALTARDLIAPHAEADFEAQRTGHYSRLEGVEEMEREIERIQSAEKDLLKAQSRVMEAAQALLKGSMSQYQSLSSELIRND